MKKYATVKYYTEEQLSNVLCDAIESGVYGSSWLRDYDAESDRAVIEGSWGSEQTPPLTDYTRIVLNRPNPTQDYEYTEPAVNTIITLEDIAKAIEKIQNDPKECEIHETYQFDYENHDATDADLVLQVAVFGKVIYG